MANDKNKNKKLVSNVDDCTAELVVASSTALESDAPVDIIDDDDSGKKAETLADAVPELETARAELHSESEKVASLEADLKARDEVHASLQQQNEALTKELEDLHTIDADHVKALEKAEVELQERKAYVQTASEEITGLLTKIAEQNASKTLLDEQYAELKQQVEEERSSIAEKEAALEAATQELEDARRKLKTSSDDGPPEIVLTDIGGTDVREVQAQIARTEDYADTLRRNLTDVTASYNKAVVQRDQLNRSIERMTKQNRELSEELAKAGVSATEMQAAIDQQQTEQKTALDQLQADHEREVEKLRLELSKARDTVTEATDMNEQLASELMQALESKEDLESALSQNDKRAEDRIEELEKQISQLTRTAEEFEHKLESRSTAIHSLLGELAQKSERIDSISEIKQVVGDIDDGIPGSLDDESAPKEITSEDHIVLAGDDTSRVSRVMIGAVGNKVLRFPLSKDRVTIGRTKENDIRLKTSYVSRRHAVVLTEGDCTRVIDSGSRNGVFVNSKRVKEHSLSDGDIVTVGDTRIRYVERHRSGT